MAMLQAGMDVARLNFSHGTFADHERRLATAREACDRCGQTMAVLQDLPGSNFGSARCRVGALPARNRRPRSRLLAERRQVLPLGTDTLAERIRRSFRGSQAPGIALFLQPDERALIDNAPVELESSDAADRGARQGDARRARSPPARVINLPDTELPLRPSPRKTAADIRFALEWGSPTTSPTSPLLHGGASDDLEAIRALMAAR